MTHADIIKATSSYVKEELFDDSSGHDWWHVYRVWRCAAQISEKERANTFVVELASLLHDISDYKLNGGNEEAGPIIAERWLKGLAVAEEVVHQVCAIIRSMGFKGDRLEDSMLSLEGKIVQDADRLDAIGAIGIARAFAYGGFKGDPIYEPNIAPNEYRDRTEYLKRKSSSVNHFYEKLLRLKVSMYTETAQRAAARRHRILEEYLRQFLVEWEGRDVIQSD